MALMIAHPYYDEYEIRDAVAELTNDPNVFSTRTDNTIIIEAPEDVISYLIKNRFEYRGETFQPVKATPWNRPEDRNAREAYRRHLNEKKLEISDL